MQIQDLHISRKGLYLSTIFFDRKKTDLLALIVLLLTSMLFVFLKKKYLTLCDIITIALLNASHTLMS